MTLFEIWIDDVIIPPLEGVMFSVFVSFRLSVRPQSQGKKWNFLGGEKRKLVGILPEKNTPFYVSKNEKRFFLSKISGGRNRFQGGGGVLPPALRKKTWPLPSEPIG